jgi:hypothetical protein
MHVKLYQNVFLDSSHGGVAKNQDDDSLKAFKVCKYKKKRSSL